MPSPYTCVIAGLGWIGLTLDASRPPAEIYTHARACMAHEGFRLVGGVDASARKRDLFREITGVPAAARLGDLPLSPGDVDVCVVATPTSVRQSVVEEGLLLKPRLLLLEKPLAATRAEAERIVALCRMHEVPLAINYFRRFDPVLAGLRELFADGRHGRFVGAVCSYSGGVLNIASHYVDMFLYWMGKPSGVRLLHDAGSVGGDLRLGFALEYDERRVTFVPINGDSDVGEIDVFFERGRFRLEYFCENLVAYEAMPDPYFAGHKRLLPVAAPMQPDLLRYQYHVYDAIWRDLECSAGIPSTGETALETLACCMAVIDEAQRASRFA